MRFDTLQDWLDWIESCHPNEIELGLGRMRQVVNELNFSFDNSQVITVAGTNGKGSCVAALEHFLTQAGLTVGCYTSPHFLRFNERIKINGTEVTDQLLIEAFEKIDQHRSATPLTYFEYGTIAALEIFTAAKLDVIVLEVGLGGRLDASNIIDADIAIVTSIALDHEDWLGSDLNVIGYEKAGVFRADKIALCGDLSPPVTVQETADKLGARFYQRGQHFDAQLIGERFNWQGVGKEQVALTLDNIPLPNLPFDSVVVAIQACQLLEANVPVSVYSQLLTVGLTGRFQQEQLAGKKLILDVAHNPAAAHYLASRLSAKPVKGKTYALVAMMADKDISGIITALETAIDGWYVAELNGIPRAMKGEDLAIIIEQHSANKVYQFSNMFKALKSALNHMADDDRLMVFGSFFTVAEVLALLQDSNLNNNNDNNIGIH